MKKTLYSLMLSEDVMREVDALAHRLGTSRSNLVNRILAERVDVRTPEQQIHEIFTAMEQLFSDSQELIPLVMPNTQRVTVRSSLAYKYHPTLRYEVELHDVFYPGEPIGTLTVNLRTQSQGLLERMGRFFRCLRRIEEQLLPAEVSYVLDDCRFVRTLAYPVKNCTFETRPLETTEISQAITSYVVLLDRMLKACVGGADAEILTDMYAADLSVRQILL